MEQLLNEDLLHELSKLADPQAAPVTTVIRLAEGERRPAAILFVDIVDFTALAEKLSPEELKVLVDKTFDVFTRQVVRYRGVVENYLGDAILAVFGQKSNDNPAELAVRSALSILDKLQEINQLLAAHGIRLQVRQGVNYGEVIAGRTLSSDPTTSETVYGDTVNTAKRLQELARPDTIVVAEGVYKLLPEFFARVERIEAATKGKAQPIKAYVVAGRASVREKDWHRHPLVIKAKLVGRTDLVEAAAAHFGAMVQQLARPLHLEAFTPQMVLVVGQAGIGKSRFVYELKAELAQRYHSRIVDLTARNYSYTTPPFSSLGEMMNQFLGLYQAKHRYARTQDALNSLLTQYGEEEAARIIRTNASDLAQVLDLPPGEAAAGLAVKESEELASQFLVGFFAAAAREAHRETGLPLLFVWDDIHWVDFSSLQCFERLLMACHRSALPVFFVLCTRPEFSPPVHWELHASLLRLQLPPLSGQEGIELVRRILPGIELAKEDEDILRERTLGNPYFIEEFCRFLLEEKMACQNEGGRYSWLPNVNLREAPPPPSVNAVLLHRLDSLQPELKDLLQKASVIGREFPIAVLDRLLSKTVPGHRSDRTKEMLRALGETGMVFELTTSAGSVEATEGKEARYIFKHNLLRDLIYDSLLTQNQRILHNLVAEAYEGCYGTDNPRYWDVIAQHYMLGENLERSSHYAMLRREAEEETAARTAALAGLAARLSGLRKSLSPDAIREECATTCTLGEAYASGGYATELKELLSKLRKECLSVATPEQATIFRLLRTVVKEEEENAPAALNAWTRLHDESAKQGNLQVLATASVHVISLLCLMADSANAVRIAEETLRAVSATTAPAERARVLIAQARALMDECRMREAVIALQEAASVARELRDPLLGGDALLEFAALRRLTGDYKAGFDHLKAASSLLEHTGDKMRLALTLAERVELELRAGSVPAAVDAAAKLMQVRPAISSYAPRLRWVPALAEVASRTGDHEGAVRLVTDGRKVAATRGFLRAEAIFTHLHAKYLLAAGSGDKALKLLDKAYPRIQPLRSRWLQSLIIGDIGSAYLARGLLVTAREFLEKSLQLLKAVNCPEEVALRNLHLGQSVYGLGQRAEGMIYAQTALTRAAEIGHRQLQMQAHLVLGQLLRDSGHRGEARQHFTAGLELAQQAEDSSYLQQFEAESRL